ncbi:putative Protein Z [Tripterygium wilfordii]|uniref:Serpin domain-containing protein n=1 Tax=Tripterygium wilfordii TaxID=458696 RepID=A0A7J7C5J9_TRIWF|nr:serpin-ZX-like [Tripterygium wilfordii]KAF5729097.1 putative Protein Z [Tripterygium wilfordii]
MGFPKMMKTAQALYSRVLCDTIKSQTARSMELSERLLSNVKERNVVFSPLSIQVLLSLTAAGSNGRTKDQLLGFLNCKSKEQLSSFSSDLMSSVLVDGASMGGPRLSFTNGVWFDKSVALKPSFKHVIDNFYRAALKQVDFRTKPNEARDQINSWAEKETNGLIKEILPVDSVDTLTRLILANALYFKGTWDEKFDPSTTKDYDFHLLNGSSVHVPFMTSDERQFVRAFDGFKVLRLPYRQGQDKRNFSMYIFLPDARDGLPALVKKLGSKSGLLDLHLLDELVEVGDFRIPKFKVSFHFEASKLLNGLGLELEDADLTEMADSKGEKLEITAIFHKAFIDVNEEGTEAAAVSTLFVGSSCMPSEIQSIDFVADHPFLFIIREDVTGAYLFVGQILDPLSG